MVFVLFHFLSFFYYYYFYCNKNVCELYFTIFIIEGLWLGESDPYNSLAMTIHSPSAYTVNQKLCRLG